MSLAPWPPLWPRNMSFCPLLSASITSSASSFTSILKQEIFRGWELNSWSWESPLYRDQVSNFLCPISFCALQRPPSVCECRLSLGCGPYHGSGLSSFPYKHILVMTLEPDIGLDPGFYDFLTVTLWESHSVVWDCPITCELATIEPLSEGHGETS